MDLRSLDPFVADPPARKGNLYKTFGGLSTGIDERPSFFNELPSDTQCRFASAGGTTLCFQNHIIPKKELIPSRRIQFDPNIEDEFLSLNKESILPFVPSAPQEKKQSLVVPILIMVLILIFV